MEANKNVFIPMGGVVEDKFTNTMAARTCINKGDKVLAVESLQGAYREGYYKFWYV